jgi:sufB/sufD family protein
MDMIINKLPSPTWRWLKVNQSALTADISSESEIVFNRPEGVAYSEIKESELENIATGIGEEFGRLVNSSKLPVHRFSVSKDTEVAEILRLDFSFNKADCSAGIIELDIAEGASLKVIMDYSLKEEAAGGFGAVSTRVRLADRASLHIIQVQRMEGAFTFVNDLGSINSEESDFNITKLLLGGKNTYDGIMVDLKGHDSKFLTEVGYLVKGNDSLDINYVSRHHGIRTQSDIEVKGVLKDRAFKIFRGTIDIVQGAVNAGGRETEEVLLIDDDVINKSIPVILCGEEDVEGAHGATIGKLDEELLLYMKSRGIPEKEIYEIMAKARIEELCQRIDDKLTVERIHELTGGAADEDF